MLLEEFDEEKLAIINPSNFSKKIDGFPKTCVSIFSKKLVDEIVDTYKPEIIAKFENANAEVPVYKINHNGVDIAFYQSPIGAPACVMSFEEAIPFGIKNFILIGCCGCLDENLEDCSIIIPTSAIRDEGTSYHYSKSCDEIELDSECIKILEEVLNKYGIKYSKGKTWTTDAFYRETKDKMERRKKQGAITVEMECSAMATVAKFRNINFAQIFYAADNLGSEEYDERSLVENGDVAKKSKIIPLGFECAKAFDEHFN